MSHPPVSIFAALAALAIAPQLLMAQDAEHGLSARQPSGTKRVVETERGWMAPYTETLPGTDVTFEMVPIPGGKFFLGSPDDEEGRKENEGPQVEVLVEPFWMARFEISWREYRAFMALYHVIKSQEMPAELTDSQRADAYTVPTPLYEPDFTFALGEEPDQPAVTMSQYAAKQYTKWISKGTGRFYRLPTEPEWEYACRAGTASAYNRSESLEELGWFADNADDETHAVGKKLPNAWGLHDMHGNVWEMTLDQYDKERYSTLESGVVAPANWPTKMFRRVIRGGAYDSDPEDLRSARRRSTKDWRTEDPNLPKSPWWFTDEEALAVGFRIVRPLNSVPETGRGKYWDADVEYLQEDVDSRISEGRGVLGGTFDEAE